MNYTPRYRYEEEAPLRANLDPRDLACPTHYDLFDIDMDELPPMPDHRPPAKRRQLWKKNT